MHCNVNASEIVSRPRASCIFFPARNEDSAEPNAAPVLRSERALRGRTKLRQVERAGEQTNGGRRSSPPVRVFLAADSSVDEDHLPLRAGVACGEPIHVHAVLQAMTD